MSERRRNEKAEKEEKKEEKEEKSWEEKWRRDPLSAIVWACIFIWAGLVLLADNADFLARFGGPNAWAIILMGAGVIVLLEVIIRLLVPSYRRPVIGSLIFGFVLLAIGLQGVIGWEFIWSFALIAIGLAILIGGLAWRR